MVIQAQHYGLHPDDLATVINCLNNGKVVILPTDTAYAFCCRSDQRSGYATICRLKHLDPRDALMSMVCRDLSQASAFFRQWDTPIYRVLNKNLPGPFTFILDSGNTAPSFLKHKRNTLGLRIPQHEVMERVMGQLDVPLMVSTVINDEDEIVGYFVDPEDMISRFEKQICCVVIDEHMMQESSTVVDMTGDEPVIIRQSKHELKF